MIEYHIDVLYIKLISLESRNLCFCDKFLSEYLKLFFWIINLFQDTIFIRHFGIQPYKAIYRAMHNFTNQRDDTTPDEIWMVEHLPVFTQGKTSKKEHMVIPSHISVIQSERGGKITYHGPGQQIMYVLLNLKRRKLNIRKLVTILEQTVVNMLSEFHIESYPRIDAHGIYVKGMKICSLALHVRKNCSSHGLAINVDMDLSPFLSIYPCGHPNMKMTQMRQWVKGITTDIIRPRLVVQFLSLLNNPPHQYISI